MSSNLHTSQTILFAANYPSDIGYAWWLMEDFWITIARTLRNTHRPLIAYPRITSLSQSVCESGIQTTELNTAPTSIRQAISVGLRLRRERVRVLYLTDQPVHSARYLIYRVFGVHSIIVHDHSPGHRSTPSPIKRLLKYLLAKYSPAAADALLSTSAFILERHRVVACFPPHRLYLVQNGILPDLPVQKSARQAFGIPIDRTLVVAASRAHPIKGLDHALDAMRHIVHQLKRTDIHFLFFGDGPTLDSLRSRAEALALDGFVSFVGKVDSPSSYFGDCDIGLHLSNAEVGFSLSTLEMMRAGIPVVVNRDRSVSGATLDGTTGVHVDPTCPTEVANAILALADNRALRIRMGVEARAHLVNNFSLDITRRSLASALSAIVTTPAQHAGEAR